MISSIVPAISGSTIGSTTPTAGLEAQIARYQKALSNCVNCDTANTREGREAIQALSDKISAVRARLIEITSRTENAQPNIPGAVPSTYIIADKVGTRLDVFA